MKTAKTTCRTAVCRTAVCRTAVCHWAACGLLAMPLLLLATTVQAQTPAVTAAQAEAAAPASAASSARPARRYLTADEKRESATAPGLLRPADPVVPQLRIPIGRNTADGVVAAPGEGAIADDAARCRAQASAADRARCGAGAQKLVAKPPLRP